MGDNPDAAPMDAFDAVGAGIDHHMADMPLIELCRHGG